MTTFPRFAPSITAFRSSSTSPSGENWNSGGPWLTKRMLFLPSLRPPRCVATAARALSVTWARTRAGLRLRSCASSITLRTGNISPIRPWNRLMASLSALLERVNRIALKGVRGSTRASTSLGSSRSTKAVSA